MLRFDNKYDEDFPGVRAKLQEMASKIFQRTAHQNTMAGAPVPTRGSHLSSTVGSF